MQYILKNISVSVDETPDFTQIIKKKYNVSLDNTDSFTILKRAIDARKKNRLQFVYTLLINTSRPLKKHVDIVEYVPEEKVLCSSIKLNSPNPFIIGMGPAGLFAALKLVEKGFKPFLFDQGDCIEKRQEKVQRFWNDKVLDPYSNVQFGEGGAGAFSDGKLTARNRNMYSDEVFEYLIRFGADPDISVDALPHVGTDRLIDIIRNIREYLVGQGCQFFYNHRLEDMMIEHGQIVSVRINNQVYTPEIVILATGNSARDVFTLLSERCVAMESKAFAIGLRIEHPLEYVNNTFYGERNDFSITGAATYKLTFKHGARSVYSFCMCPGGYVIPAHSEVDGQVVNGMSFTARDNGFSNSALVVNVKADEFGIDVFNGMNYQRQLERSVFDDFVAPAQNVSDFVANKMGLTRQIKNSSYFFEARTVNFHDWLPQFACESLMKALCEFDKKYAGFISKGLFIGVETRTSSPIRIVRDSERLASVNVSNLYPIGEGAGYAGGIVSSAGDGVRIGSMFF